MGMGEPLLNEAEVHRALDVLLSPQCLDLSPVHMFFSRRSAFPTPWSAAPSGSRDWGWRSACTAPGRNSASASFRWPDAILSNLLRKAMEQLASIQRHPLMIEYLLLDGLNDTDEDLQELIAYLRGLQVHINLIPYNPIREAPGLIGTAAERRRWFAAALTAAGFTVTVRYSLGADIAAACGQLVRLEPVLSEEGVAV